MKQFAADILTRLTNWNLTRLRNGVNPHLDREEIRFAQINFSQFGEDMAVLRWIDRLREVTRIYVDVGCFHPIHCSNTLLLHKSGWRGVNVDMAPEKIALFRKLRPLDYSVAAAVSSRVQTMLGFQYGNGLTERIGRSGNPVLSSVIGEKPVSTREVITQTLDAILADAPWPIPQIGYLNVDCEGHDLEVLKGLDFARYRPAIVTVEAAEEDERREMGLYLETCGYSHRETLYKTLLYTC